MASRPTVSVYNGASSKDEVAASVPLPGVFSAPLRADLVNFVFTQIAKNKRQAYAVAAETAGMNPAASSWGTGRAVSRIPRVPGGGTAASGQGAFGNMCRNGRMAHPTRPWRKWTRKTSLGHRRFAVASAVAATAIPALVMARGHRVSKVPELPLVLQVGDVSKVKDGYALLERFGVSEDVDKAKESKTLRRGAGKARNRRYVSRLGPLVVYGPQAKAAHVDRAFRNLPGVDVCSVGALNLLQLAPGGHVGRLVVWTQDAFEQLDQVFGDAPGAKAALKTGFTLPRASMTTADVARIINSDEVQKAVRPAKPVPRSSLKKRNPLRNVKHLIKLNPYAEVHIRAEVRAAEARAAGTVQKKRAAAAAAGGAEAGSTKKQRREFIEKLLQ